MTQILAIVQLTWMIWLPIALTLFFIALRLGLRLRRNPDIVPTRATRRTTRRMVTIALVLGVLFAWMQKSLYDDAFISFRYAKNLLAGHGLVFNIGERVEGYTNFLWTVLLAGLAWLTGGEIAYLALFGCLICFMANLLVVWRIGRRLSAPEPGQFHLPVAVLWLAVQQAFHRYGTTGMETMFASLLVNLAVWAMVARRRPAATGLAAGLLILAALTRPDHGLFYAFLGMTVLWDHSERLRQAWRTGNPLRPVLKAGFVESAIFAAPFTAYALYLVWKWYYYGSLLPNTFYANSAFLSYWEQGFAYSMLTIIFNHLYVLLPLGFWWLFTGGDPHARTFKRFAGLSLLLYPLYVMKIGGDKMENRFFITLFPLLILGVEQLLHRLARLDGRRLSRQTVVLAALVCGTLHGLYIPITTSGLLRVADPSKLYHVHSLRPLAIGPRLSRLDYREHARLFKRAFVDRGFQPLMATGFLGMFGYYSEMPIIDTYGLTDAYIGRRPVARRGRIGHEKSATTAYLDYRGVRLMPGGPEDLSEKYALLAFGEEKPAFATLYRYDPELIAAMREKVPGVVYTSFPDYLDAATPDLVEHEPPVVAETLKEFDHYYFSLNPDPLRRRPFLARFIHLRSFEKQVLPKGTKKTGAFQQPFLRPVTDGDFEIDNYQGDVLLASDREGTGVLRFPKMVIRGDYIGFLLGGAKDNPHVQVRLFVEDQLVRSATGTGSDRLQFVTWRVDQWKGKSARLALVDDSPTGRLLFDMFYEAEKKPPARLMEALAAVSGE